MFEAAVSKFVKSVGKESLIGVPSLDEANKCKPFQIVVKKNRKWFWQSAKYEATPFQLHELLTDPEPLDKDVSTDSRKLTTYDKTYKFDINGKIGAKLQKLLDIELTAEDDINVDAKFGDITKQEVDQPMLMKQLEKRYLDVSHTFLRQIRENERNVLCVIVGTAAVAEDGEVHMHVTLKGDEKIQAGMTIGNNGGEESEGGSLSDESDKKLAIPKGTPLAYNLCELYVKSSGALELIIERGSQGGFEKPSKDETDASDDELEVEDEDDDRVDETWNTKISLEEQFMPLLELSIPDRLPLTIYILDICCCPRDVLTLKCVLQDAVRDSEDPKFKHLMHKVQQINPIKAILRNVGFEIRDSNLALIYPTEKSPLLVTMLAVFQALMEMDDDETMALNECNGNYAKDLLHLLNGALLGMTLNIDDPALSILYSEPNPGQDFAETLGFQVTSKGNIVSESDNKSELEGAYRAVYALWHKIHEGHHDKHHKWHCAIL